MAQPNVSATSFDDNLDEHDSYDVELTEASHDDSNFDAELTDGAQESGNGESITDDPVCDYQLLVFNCKNISLILRQSDVF